MFVSFGGCNACRPFVDGCGSSYENFPTRTARGEILHARSGVYLRKKLYLFPVLGQSTVTDRKHRAEYI